tara:strand:+ start:295 stop:825 length:531 start_codon:yes stop_codon:yes gene_type:complete
MNDNHIIVAGQTVQVGPMLAHMMLSSQELQDRLLSLSGATDSISETQFDTQGNGVITLELVIAMGLPMLTVCYIDDTFTATFEHVGGDSIETLEMTFDSEEMITLWLEDALEASRSNGQPIALPLVNRFGEPLSVTVTDIEAKPTGGEQWIGTGDVWSAYMDEGLQREAEASRKAA